MSGEYNENADASQRAELYGPENDGYYTSQLRDWIPLCPQLKDSGVRLYWIMRALVVEKYGPVRKVTLLQLCYLLPAKPVKAGEPVKPSSLARVRGLLADLSAVGLISTPEGGPVKTSSRAGASGAPLRIRINDRPQRGYNGPRNAFALLDAVRKPAAEAAERAVKKERERALKKRAEQAAAGAGQISSPDGAGQISSPRGQISSPRGQISSPHPGDDLQDREPPLSPSAQSFRSDPVPSVRPSVPVGEAHTTDTDGGTDGGSVIEAQAEGPAAAVGGAPVVPVVRPSEGAAVLLAVGQRVPELAVSGKVLLDQGLRLDGLLASGWTVAELVAALSVPLDGPIRRSAGAVISARISALPITPVRLALAGGGVPRQVDHVDHGAKEHRPAAPAPRLPRLCECGAELVRGEMQCRSCAGWPECGGGCGRQLEPSGPATCSACTLAEHQARIAAAVVPTGDGTCPGWGGVPCGRVALSLGLCGRCRTVAEHEIAEEAEQVERERAEAAFAELRGQWRELEELDAEARAALWLEILADAYAEHERRERAAAGRAEREARERAETERLRAQIAEENPEMVATLTARRAT
ncbi:hypothetical protein B7755_052175 [Streptomyces sp. NBS 14/10]|uniref:hypothetical protein n=1 Tax=Streptomyces sp. NBS 14/10 TaxID=1945643 RepID=UPI000B8003F2|nr:hypothetical protein [Streptomyces sp. NBS 14/10]KAK1176706.1 hypothetical protein B7755_052175 [Streptomyces sp. NBS 14/10]